MQIPLRMCWAITIHKSQGMTVGPLEQIKRVVVDLGGKDVAKWCTGGAFVQLSRATEVGSLAISGSVDGEQFMARGGCLDKKAHEVAVEDARLLDMYVHTKQRRTVASDEVGPTCWLTSMGEFQCLCDIAGSGGGESFWVGV